MPTDKRLTPGDIAAAADAYGLEPALIEAVRRVESGRYGGFLGSGEPVILFEPHLFHRMTAGVYGTSHPHLSYRRWGALPYGSLADQHPKLQEAVALDREAALQACSWGLFQVLGANWGTCDYGSLQEFVNAAYRHERDHLDMMLRYCRHVGILDDLRERQWSAFARGYNGPAFARHGYPTRLAAAYEAARESTHGA